MRLFLTIKTHTAKPKMIKKLGTEYLNENVSKEIEAYKIYVIPNFIPPTLPDDSTAEGANSLDLNQKEDLHVVHKWDKGFVKYDGIILNWHKYFVQAEEGQVNLIWSK